MAPRLPLLLWNAHRCAPGQAVLMLLGLALSVAVVVAIDLAVDSARGAFLDSRRALSGSATHQISADGGQVPAAVLAELRAQGLWRSAPLVEREVLHAGSGARLRLLGIDPLSEAALRPWLAGRVGAGRSANAASVDPGALIGRRDAVLLPQRLATRLALVPGDALVLGVDGRRVELQVLAVLPDDSLPAGSGDWLLADLAAAQAVLRMDGFTRVDLIADAAQAARIAAALPLGLRLIATTEQDTQLAAMSGAFEINLKALSLLALLVGVFVVFQTLSFLALQRRRLIGLLRALGVSNRDLSGLMLGEALLVGVLAAGLGIALGIALGSVLLQGLARSYGELFYRVEVTALSLSPLLLGKAAALAMFGALVAVLLPLRDALGVPVLDALGRGSAGLRAPERRLRALLLPALLLFAGGLLLILYRPQDLLWSFAGLFVCLIAALGLIPWAAGHALRGLEQTVRAGPVRWRWLIAGTRRTLGRTGIALAALSLAIATVIGMSSMIHSFREALSVWIDRSLQAQVYLSASGRGALPEGLVEAAQALEGVEAIGLTRRSQRLPGSGPLEIVGMQLPAQGRGGFDLIAGGDAPELWLRFAQGDALISEPLAERLGLGVGDRISLPTVEGETALRVAAIYRDYSSPQGVLTLDLEQYRRLFADSAVGALALYAPASESARLKAGLEALLDARHPGQAGLQAFTAAEIRAISLEVFARTFAITDVLRLLAGLIAVVAVLGALSALAIERGREFALLRAIGLTPVELSRLQRLQGGMLGLIAGLAALPLGLGLAVLLIEVINRRSFGWSMQLVLPWTQIASAIAVSTLAAVLAAWWPARRSVGAALSRQLRGGEV
ncbi:MAG: ABC transporter permease [Aquimonas sp.]|nr:ABC transporter permease [Aquimonas sp.]